MSCRFLQRCYYFRMSMSLRNWKGFFQFLGILLAVGLFIQLVILNMAVLYVYNTSIGAASRFNEIQGSFIDKVQSMEFAKNLLKTGKNGGVKKLLEMSVDRMYLVRVGQDESGDLYKMGFDMSNDGEAFYIYKRILLRSKFRYSRLVVDIGANDGLLSSNSYNFIQWGWDAILVEPQKTQLDMAKKNTAKYRDMSRKQRQTVTFVQALIGNKNGMENLVVSNDLASMESHILSPEKDTDKYVDSSSILQVPSMTVKTFAQRYKVPIYFGVLSVDAEGVSDKIVHKWMNLGYRPAYIIFEALHNEEHIEQTKGFLATFNYSYLIRLGWNYIFEHDGEPKINDKKSGD